MKITKIKAGIYKVDYNGRTVMVMGGANYNPDSKFFRDGRFEIWNADSRENCTDEVCWACGAPSKKVALQWIKKAFNA